MLLRLHSRSEMGKAANYVGSLASVSFPAGGDSCLVAEVFPSKT